MVLSIGDVLTHKLVFDHFSDHDIFIVIQMVDGSSAKDLKVTLCQSGQFKKESTEVYQRYTEMYLTDVMTSLIHVQDVTNC